MRIYNSMTRRKEELTPLEDNHYKIYVCGPLSMIFFTSATRDRLSRLTRLGDT